METISLSGIPFHLNSDALAKRLHVPDDPAYLKEFQRIIEKIQAIGQPKAVFGVAYVEEKGDDYVVIDGIRFQSRVLRVNLDQVFRVFPYVATCGVEVDEWMNNEEDDILFRFWADGIKEDLLRAASKALGEAVASHFKPGHTAQMNPGSLPDWPLTEQQPLFSLIGEVEAKIGVQLSESCLMMPNKSVSGIRFPTENKYENCQLCPREGCPGRRTPYDSELFAQRYRK